MVLVPPRIEVAPQFVDAAIDLLAERDPTDRVQDGAMEAFAQMRLVCGLFVL